MIHLSTFAKMFRGARLCRQQGLDIPMLVLVYASIDTLAWTVYGGSIKSVRQRFIKFCDEYLTPNSKLNCTSLELYSARCSVVHNLGWESDLCATGKARAVFYSFGTDDPTSAQKAYDQEYPGKYVAVRADDLLEAVESCANELVSRAETDPKLRVRLNEAAGKQYMSMESRASDEFFKNVIKGGS